MRIAILLLLAAIPAFGAWPNGFTYRRTIDLDHTKVNSDLTNFPVLISGTLTYLRTTGNGGNVTNANGYDIIFTSDAGGMSKLNWETVFYSATLGIVEYHVQVPTVSRTTNTRIFLFYSNASVTTDQSNRTSTWDANYKGVFHLGDQAASTTVTDATSTAANGTASRNTNLTSAGGKIGNGLAFDGGSDYVTRDSQNYGSGTAFTFSAWVQTSSLLNMKIYTEARATDLNGYAFFGENESGTGTASIYVADSAGVQGLFNTGSLSLGDGNWHYIVGTQSSKSSRALYVDGVLRGTNSTLIGTATLNQSTIGANRSNGGIFNYLNGVLDEIRFSNSARSADWIAAEYNNQNSPSTFYTIASTAETGGIKHRVIQ